MQELPGEFTTFDFIPGIPAPFNFGLAILLNQKMLTLGEKIQTAPPLLPMLVEGQSFIDAQVRLRLGPSPSPNPVRAPAPAPTLVMTCPSLYPNPNAGRAVRAPNPPLTHP